MTILLFRARSDRKSIKIGKGLERFLLRYRCHHRFEISCMSQDNGDL